ncbi:MAG: FesM, partial [Anaerolineae bacterium]|nr:FesM [Anaerolineae bacterium]
MPSSRTRRPPDLLRWPLLGRFLKWRYARIALQAPLLLIAALIIFDGLFGPQLAPKNLATVGVWLHYRGFVVLALLVAGNLFCMACPFMLPRRIGRWLRERFWGGGRPVPRLLRNKWPALVLVVLFFFAYERFSLWASPWWTAWIALAYFAVAFAVDTIFRGAAFCKHVCPLGQFNFFGALNSPFEIRIRQGALCAACRTKDCIRGPQGCELALFQPAKVGNMDCTFCLDCIHACPYDNIGIIGRLPTAELWRDPFRSGIGRLSRRPDLAALIAVLVFGSFINALAMIGPVYALREEIGRGLGAAAPTLELVFIFVVGLILLPGAMLTAAGWVTRRRLGPSAEPLAAVISRFIYGLVPLGFGMWLAHYSFHFLTGGLTLVPVLQSFGADSGLWQGPVLWGLGPLVPEEWLFPIEALFLYMGAFGSMITAVQIARQRVAQTPAPRPGALAVAAPWLVLILALLIVGLVIL